MRPRERLLALGTGLLLGGWLLDSLAIEPALAWLAKVRTETADAHREAAEAKVLIDRKDRIAAEWRGRHAAGLLDDGDAARFRIQQLLAAGARSSGFTIDNVGGGQLVPAAHEKPYDALRLTVAGQGTLAQATAFIAAIEAAPMPMRIERCELAAGDGRKDRVDLAMTMSTRVVNAAGRAGRAVPEGTPPWTPEPRDGALDKEILASRPFLVDRRPARTAPPAAEGGASAAAAAHPSAPPGWALVGLAVTSEVPSAFLRNLADGTERVLHPGDELDGQRMVAVEAGGLRLKSADGEHLVTVGSDLTGRPAGAARAPTAAVGTSTSAPATAAATPAGGAPAVPGAAPTTVTDPDREAILQRLRQQRNRSP